MIRPIRNANDDFSQVRKMTRPIKRHGGAWVSRQMSRLLQKYPFWSGIECGLSVDCLERKKVVSFMEPRSGKTNGFQDVCSRHLNLYIITIPYNFLKLDSRFPILFPRFSLLFAGKENNLFGFESIMEIWINRKILTFIKRKIASKIFDKKVKLS